MMAKAEAVDGYVFTAADCVQLHGGVGFTWEFDPHIHLKRARMNEMLVANNPAARDIAASNSPSRRAPVAPRWSCRRYDHRSSP